MLLRRHCAWTLFEHCRSTLTGSRCRTLHTMALARVLVACVHRIWKANPIHVIGIRLRKQVGTEAS